MIDIYIYFKYQTINQNINQNIRKVKLEMLTIANVFNGMTDKFVDCMCVNSVYTNKYVIEISRPSKNSIYTTIYNHYTLAQMHETIQTAVSVIPVKPGSIEMVQIDTSSDYIPASQAVTDAEIRDIFVFDTESNSILSIPCDKDTTLVEFMDANPSKLKPYYSVSMMSMVYKIYIIDYAYLRQKPQLARLKKIV